MNIFNKPCSFYPMPTSPGGKDPKYWLFVHIEQGLYKKSTAQFGLLLFKNGVSNNSWTCTPVHLISLAA